MELLKLLSANEIVAQIICFLILFFLLRAFAWKKILGFLDARREKIASEFNQIQETKKGLEDMRIDYQDKITKISDESKRIILEAVHESRIVAEDIKKKAQVESARIIESARAQIQYEVSQAKEELKENIVNLAISVSENIIEEKLTEKADKKMAEDFLNKLNGIEEKK